MAKAGAGARFTQEIPQAYDLIIANPPYVRTQIMGASQAQLLAQQFGLSGRIDLYYAFILGMARVLKPQGISGIIVSNRFMTIKSGAPVRQALLEQFNIRHVWDLGDTKFFRAAVLPSVLLLKGKNSREAHISAYTSVYETTEPQTGFATNPIEALSKEGVIEVEDGRRFLVRHGKLSTNGTPDGVWRIATEAIDTWLSTVKTHMWGTFRDIGRIRVGVKTCADKVFIRSDWQDMPGGERPELLRPLITHHVSRHFKALTPEKPRQILYPHEVVQGHRRAVDLTKYPRTKAYLERHRPTLEGRKYVLAAGRAWYEIWVPQDPDVWDQPKLVFRDIAKRPTFWIDQDGSLVNGDCYWLICEDPAQTDLLWLAMAVGNSTFVERFYDYRFHTMLYAGRRRFLSQYVEEFPLPDPHNALGKAIIRRAKQIYNFIPSARAKHLEKELDRLVRQAFGFPLEEVGR